MARTRSLSRGRTVVLLALVALVLLSVAGCKKSTDTGTQGGSGTTQQYTLEDLKNQQLADQQEGLLFSYLDLGGLDALESRFGKPSKSYQTLADGSADGLLVMSDDHEWYYLTGETGGTEIVMAHSVQALDGQSPTDADQKFLSTIVDGKTTAAEAEAYFKQAGGENYAPTEPNRQALKIPAYVWELQDGSGFLVWDYSKLTKEQLAEYDFQEGEGPYRAAWWDSTRFRTYPAAEEEVPLEETSTPTP